MIEDIFISPHPDDIAYSCYGAFHLSNNPHLLTVFCRSKYTTNHSLYTRNENTVTEVRKKEDNLFAELNNASYIGFDFPDSSLTLNGVKETSLYANPYLSQIKKIIYDYLVLRNDFNLYIPMGNGWHNDHRDIHRIMIYLYKEGYIHCNKLYLYEDLPYFAETASSFSITSYLQSEGLHNPMPTQHRIDLTDFKNLWTDNYNIYKSQYDKKEFCQILNYKYTHKTNRIQEILWEI